MELRDVARAQMEIVNCISSRLKDCGVEVSDKTDLKAEVFDLYNKGFGCDALCLEKLLDAYKLVDKAFNVWRDGGLL